MAIVTGCSLFGQESKRDPLLRKDDEAARTRFHDEANTCKVSNHFWSIRDRLHFGLLTRTAAIANYLLVPRKITSRCRASCTGALFLFYATVGNLLC